MGLSSTLSAREEIRVEKNTDQSPWPSSCQLRTTETGQQPLPLDHFIVEDEHVYAGRHLIFDFWGASKLDEISLMDTALRECVAVCHATLLHIHLHHFTPNVGVSCVAVLAESHISVHTWPELNYAAFDVFMCGDAKPHLSVPVLEKAFSPEKVDIKTLKRGQLSGK